MVCVNVANVPRVAAAAAVPGGSPRRFASFDKLPLSPAHAGALA